MNAVRGDGVISGADVAVTDVAVTDVAVTDVAVTDVLHLQDPLPLEQGGRLEGCRIGYRLHGKRGGPVVLVLGGISADRHVTSRSASEGAGWWEVAVGDGRAIDTRRYAVLSIDWLGGAGTSSGPVSGAKFPTIATHDQAAAVVGVMRHLRIARLHAAIGASYGGMVVLALAERFPERLERAIVIGAAHESHPMATAWRSIQRQVVTLGTTCGREHDGLRLARALAMTTYRTATEFAQRFAVEPVETADGFRFPVESYLQHHGDKFAARFSSESFLRLSESNDLHRVCPEAIKTPVTLIGVDSDMLVPPWQTRELAERLRHCEGCHIVTSVYGHDAFLKDECIPAIAADVLARDTAS